MVRAGAPAAAPSRIAAHSATTGAGLKTAIPPNSAGRAVQQRRRNKGKVEGIDFASEESKGKPESRFCHRHAEDRSSDVPSGATKDTPESSRGRLHEPPSKGLPVEHRLNEWHNKKPPGKDSTDAKLNSGAFARLGGGAGAAWQQPRATLDCVQDLDRVAQTAATVRKRLGGGLGEGHLQAALRRQMETDQAAVAAAAAAAGGSVDHRLAEAVEAAQAQEVLEKALRFSRMREVGKLVQQSSWVQTALVLIGATPSARPAALSWPQACCLLSTIRERSFHRLPMCPQKAPCAAQRSHDG